MNQSIDPLKVTNVVADLLAADEALSALVGNKIFPIVAPNGTPGNYIVYQRDGYKEQGTKTGVAWRQPFVILACVSSNYRESQQIASSACDCLCGEFRDPYMRIALEDSTEDYDGKKYVQALKFSITV